MTSIKKWIQLLMFVVLFVHESNCIALSILENENSNSNHEKKLFLDSISFPNTDLLVTVSKTSLNINLENKTKTTELQNILDLTTQSTPITNDEDFGKTGKCFMFMNNQLS